MSGNNCLTVEKFSLLEYFATKDIENTETTHENSRLSLWKTITDKNRKSGVKHALGHFLVSLTDY